jgi:hypothetical protein
MARKSRKLIEIFGIQGKKVSIVPTTRGFNLTELYSKKESMLDGYMGAIAYDPKWKKYVLVDLDKGFQMSLECIKEAFEMTEKFWGNKPLPKLEE